VPFKPRRAGRDRVDGTDRRAEQRPKKPAIERFQTVCNL